MRDLAAILAVYQDAEACFEAEKTAARRSDPVRLPGVESKQQINDQAYFVLCWGQLEAEINAVCREAISNRQALSEWERRRGWDIYDLNDKRLSGLSFEDRAALVTDRDPSKGRGRPYARIMQYYALRNQIAHGDVLARRIDLPEVVRDMYVIQSQLKR